MSPLYITDRPTEILAIVSIMVLTLLHGFFTMAKTALVTVRHARLQHSVSENAETGGVRGLQVLTRDPARVFATAQVGITLATDRKSVV